MMNRLFFALGLRLLKANMSVLRLHDGAIVVLRSVRSQEIIDDLSHWLTREKVALPKGIVLGLHPDDSIAELSDEDLRRVGLMRRSNPGQYVRQSSYEG
jgi:hypothetical protein